MKKVVSQKRQSNLHIITNIDFVYVVLHLRAFAVRQRSQENFKAHIYSLPNTKFPKQNYIKLAN